jgi:hypothetical protein
MDLTQLANLGEFIGGVAVLVTLAYLAAQVRQSNKFAAGDAMRSFLTEYNATVRGTNDPDLNRLIRKGFVDFDNMSNEEKSLVHSLLITHMMLAQTAYVLDKRGVGDPDLMELAFGLNAVAINTPGLESWWNQAKKFFNPDFVALFDRERAKSPSAIDIIPWFAPDTAERESRSTS